MKHAMGGGGRKEGGKERQPDAAGPWGWRPGDKAFLRASGRKES